MSPITVRCPGCQKGYAVPAAKVGKRVKCKACQREFVIEDPNPAPVELVDDPFGGGYADIAAIEPPPIAAPPIYSAATISSGKTSNAFAVTSLVCGLVFCVPLSGIAAVVFGVLGLIRSGKAGGKGRGMSIAGIILGGATTVILPILISILLPALAMARAQADRAKCAGQMHQIGVAIIQYASQNGGKIPPDLATLVNNGTVSPSILICPDDKSAATTGAQSSYTLLTPGAMLNALPPQQPILDEPLSDHDVGANFLFPDGHVAWFQGTAAMAMIASAPQPQPPSPIRSFAGPTNPPGANPIPQPIIPIPGPPMRADPLAGFRREVTGTWKCPSAKIDGKITGPGTVTFNPDFSFAFHVDGPDGPVDFSGRWSVRTDSIMMRVDKQTGCSISLLGWYVDFITNHHLDIEVQNSPEEWTRQ